MDVFPFLSSHFSLLWCVLQLICLFIFFLVRFFSYSVWLSLMGCRVAHSEHISHGMWTMECFFQSFTSGTSSSSFCLFSLPAAAASARRFGGCDVYIAHEFLNDAAWHQSRSEFFTAFPLNHHPEPLLPLESSDSSLSLLQRIISKMWLTKNRIKCILCCRCAGKHAGTFTVN